MTSIMPKKNENEYTFSQYFYGNPPPSSISGPSAGECKEDSVSPCFNKDCENCKRNHKQQIQQLNLNLLSKDK